MGTLQSAGLVLSAIVASAGLVAGCDMYDHPCYDLGMNSDYVAIMDEDTEQFLRDYGYVPEGECGTETASFRSFPITIGTCTGYFSYTNMTEEYSLTRTSSEVDTNLYVGTKIRENIPTADNLFKHYPLYAHCKP